METSAMAESAPAPVQDMTLPYPPSFVDRITDGVSRLPVPAWLVYLAVTLGLTLGYMASKWLDGSLAPGEFLPTLMLSCVTPVYGLALVHYLDHYAKSALDDFRPVMRITEDEYQTLRYQLTTLRPRTALIAAAIGALYGVSGIFYITPDEAHRLRIFMTPLSVVLDLLALALGYISAAILIYHSVRQLRMISRIYTDYAQVDLFNLGPIYALSGLTARTALGFGIISYAWAYVSVTLQTSAGLSAPNLAEPIISSSVVVAVFLLPLLGAHQLLRKEKARLQAEAARHMSATIAELHRRREAGEYQEMDGVNGTLDALQKEQAVLDKISTWPWDSATLRGVATAILLPIFLWFVTKILERFVSF